MADAKRLKAAPYASEWNFGASSPEDAASFFGTFVDYVTCAGTDRTVVVSRCSSQLLTAVLCPHGAVSCRVVSCRVVSCRVPCAVCRVLSAVVWVVVGNVAAFESRRIAYTGWQYKK
jgi:hypothetical protein